MLSLQNTLVARALIATSFVLGSGSLAWADESAVADRVAIAQQQFAHEIGSLANWAASRGLNAEAEETRAWVQPRDPMLCWIPRLPSEVQPSEPPAGSSPDQTEWHSRFHTLRVAHGEALFQLAEAAVAEAQYGQARLLILEAARQSPDNEKYRELLGFRRYRGHWHTPWEIQQFEDGKVWHERFGWLRASEVERYEQGLRSVPTIRFQNRFVRGGWVSAEREAELRSEIENGWVIETEHYSVRTNTSLEEGVRLAKRLEELNWVWRQLFYSVWATVGEQKDVLEPPRRTPRRVAHEVVYYRNKDEYVAALAMLTMGDITQSTGIYFGSQQRAYFFAGSEFSEITLLHEGTHQLFSEVNPKMRATSSRPNYWENARANFWIVEGIACYMETLAERDGFYTVGGVTSDRMRAAAYRSVELDWHKPISDLTRYGMLQLVHDSEIAAIYSQSTGLATFLMHGQDGKYRDALLKYIEGVYTGNIDPNALEKMMGEESETLDEEYRAFVKERVKIRG
jgi:hypothetical protein